jgi:PilZ domain
MEHRWGERFAVRMTVELSGGSAPPVAGSLENVSASGAFVRTEERGPPRGPVVVILRQEIFDRIRSVRLPAYVVRETESGVGIEWCQFAPRAVRELMLQGRGAGPDETRRRAARKTRRPSHEPDTVLMLPRALPAADPPAIRTRT